MTQHALPIRNLSRREGEEVLDMVRDALTVRYRELYGTTRGDPESVVEADVGRGVHIFLWGLPPDRRLPLRAYHAGITFKNGVPINYIEGISLFEWMEVGFNTFYAFRDGETAWIYSKVLHLLHQLTNVTCFSVYPYQLGDQNEEAIKSGAFWFYRKLGFRPGHPELLAMTQREETRIAGDPAHRTSAARCANWLPGMCFTNSAAGRKDCGTASPCETSAWRCSVRWRRSSKAIPKRMRRAACGALAQICEWTRDDGAAASSQRSETSLSCALVPGLRLVGAAAQKQALVEIIRAKVRPTKQAICGCCKSIKALRRHWLSWDRRAQTA